MIGPGGIVGYRSEPDAIWMMMPAAAVTIPATFSLPAADSVGRLLGEYLHGVLGCLPDEPLPARMRPDRPRVVGAGAALACRGSAYTGYAVAVRLAKCSADAGSASPTIPVHQRDGPEYKSPGHSKYGGRGRR